MLYPVKVYYSTGFGAGNIPSSPEILENAQSKEYPSVWMKQDRYIATVKIKAEWEDIKNVDYCQIGSTYYTVRNIEQLNGVSVLTLSMDPLTSVGGIKNIDILDGWVKRASHKSNEFFSNTLPVSFEQTSQSVIEGPYPVEENADNYGHCLIGAIVDMENSEHIAHDYVDAATKSTVTVPTLPVPEKNTLSEMSTNAQPAGWPTNLQQYLPAVSLYRLFDYDFRDPDNPKITNNPSIHQAFTELLSLGQLSAFTSCYMLPSSYAVPYTSSGTLSGAGFIDSVKGLFREVSYTKLPYKYGNYVPKNNRVYATGNKYTIISLASGESATFDATELYSGGSYPEFYVYADPAPNGKPYCQPSYYEHHRTGLFEQSIKGAEWQSTPLVIRQNTNEARATVDYIRATQDMYRGATRATQDDINRLYGSTINIVSGAGMAAVGGDLGAAMSIGTAQGAYTGMVSDMTNAARRIEDINIEKQRRNFDTRASLNLVTPQVLFPHDANIQGYAGNGFFIYREHLSDQDMERLDNEFTYYGEPDSRRLEKSDLNSHAHFNFIQADNVQVIGDFSLNMRNAISELFAGGVRLWHELPNIDAMTNNPLKGA